MNANTRTDIEALIQAASEASLAVFAGTLNAPPSPEFQNLRRLNVKLLEAIALAKNALKAEK